MSEKELTESWKDKNYEVMLTQYYFKVVTYLKEASRLAVLPNLRIAFTEVKSLAYSLIYSPHHLQEFEKKVKPVLEDVELILYGKPENARVGNLMSKYGIMITSDRHGKTSVENAQVLISELWEVLFLLKQWAYEQGMFMVKPMSRKLGTEAIEDALTQ